MSTSTTTTNAKQRFPRLGGEESDHITSTVRGAVKPPDLVFRSRREALVPPPATATNGAQQERRGPRWRQWLPFASSRNERERIALIKARLRTTTTTNQQHHDGQSPSSSPLREPSPRQQEQRLHAWDLTFLMSVGCVLGLVLLVHLFTTGRALLASPLGGVQAALLGHALPCRNPDAAMYSLHVLQQLCGLELELLGHSFTPLGQIQLVDDNLHRYLYCQLLEQRSRLPHQLD